MREPPRPMPIVLGLSQGAALRLVDPTTSCWTFSPWFRLDRLAELAGRLNQLRKEQSRLSQHVRVGRLPSPQLVYRDHKFQP